ncbi:DUF4240 domain-containing protein [Paraflavitalea soli]|uniref:DUF4240 domain-containing protein n=1 Tax=Paraflavitalea soli TaxID=2315862 RepID=A0A3B7MNK7_9BACT|nr:DUF4240 domain-containing protein [Paraflavitalea soli]AXY74536.1 DUF4240 domain-containing protein [Paraflavitalea soli]
MPRFHMIKAVVKGSLIWIFYISLAACAQTTAVKPQSDTTALQVLPATAKMDTTYFWEIMDDAFRKGGFNNKRKEDAILTALTRLTPQQIMDFEIIFQQKIDESNTWNNMAAQTIIEGGSSDDRFYYFRCWLISLGKKNFYETLRNPDHLASLDIPVNKEHHYGEVLFEELIPLSDQAYGIVTKKQVADDSFPRANASKKGLYFDSGGETKGKEWEDDKELLKIAPLLSGKFKII